MSKPPLPQPVTVEGNRLMFTRAQLIAYGRACFEAGQADKPAPKAEPSDDVSKLFRAFGMSP